MYEFWRKNLVKMKKAFYNYFKEIFDRSLYYGMNYNAHWNRNFEAVSPQASDCTSQFITWFNLVNILWKKYEPYWERPPGRRGEAASLKYIVEGVLNYHKSFFLSKIQSWAFPWIFYECLKMFSRWDTGVRKNFHWN